MKLLFPPNLYPWAPERYLKEMLHPNFDEFRLIDDVAVPAMQRSAA